ncbi:MAG: glycosyltransferase, partial [Acidobacteriota bacterium]
MAFRLKTTKLWLLLRDEGFAGLRAKISDKRRDRSEERRYQRWIERGSLDDGRRRQIREMVKALPQTPLISILLPVYNTDERFLRLCVESVKSQLYPYWQLCIADDASTAKHVRPILEKYASEDERVKVIFRETNGHISAASNTALELVSGEFTTLLDHDDELSEDALFWIAQEIDDHKNAELIYSDEDLVDDRGRRSRPRFKPDWSPDLFLSLNLLNHLVAFRTDTLKKAGGFREGFEGSQDYDLELRFVEQIPEVAVRHIP